MEHDQLFERLWNGEAAMEEWTATVSGGAAKAITDDVIAIHTGYLFGNATAIRTNDGLVLVDTGSRETATQTLTTLRHWDNAPVHTIVYTHGHIDHTWGARLLDQEADARGIARPRIIAHRNVLHRFERYDATHGLNSLVMGRQFNQPGYTFPDNHRRPDQVYDDTLGITVGGIRIELAHGRGETDDATFVWLPEKRILISGDFVIWVFPNAGNPRKVQRYAPDWAAALRRMQGLVPAVLIPGHGPVVFGQERAAKILGDGAELLESLVAQTVALMNNGASSTRSCTPSRHRQVFSRSPTCCRSMTTRSLSSGTSGTSTRAGSMAILLISSPRSPSNWPMRSLAWQVVPRNSPDAQRRCSRPDRHDWQHI